MLRKMSLGFLLCFIYMALPLVLPSCASGGGVSTNATANWPAWVRDPYTRYDRQANVAAVGNGSSREAAEKSALGNLVAFFGQSIQVDQTVVESFQQAERNGVITDWSGRTGIENRILTSASLDSLVGAEIGDIWSDGRDYYAVAVLNKASAIRIYSDIIRANRTMIENLVNISTTGRNTLESFARYQFAATVADMTLPYANLLSVIGGPAQALSSGDDYRLLALNITRAIPVAVRVRNDRSRRIEGAFAKALSDLGFQSGGGGSPASAAARYALDVNIVSSPVEIANSPNRWTRIEVTANFVEAGSGAVLFPYNFNQREGHSTQAEADNRAYMAAERKINEEYAKLLSGYLNQLLPKR